MKRIYHTYDKWECYPAGLYETQPPDGMTPKQAIEEYGKFLRDSPRFEAALERVITEWKNSCEHYLSNESMNRIAWLGQAAMCIDTRVPAGYRGGFNSLTPQEQAAANNLALQYLNKWLERRGEPSTDLEGAGISAKANLY